MTTQVLKVNWIHPTSIEKWLSKMAIGRTLNVCCGMSTVGEVRIDIAPESNRTEEGDLFHLGYGAGSFDTVICDPPFSYYNRLAWVFELSKLARKRFLLSSPTINLAFTMNKRFTANLWALGDSSTPTFLRLYWCFDRKDDLLDV